MKTYLLQPPGTLALIGRAVSLMAGIGAGGVALIERWSHYRVDCFTVAGNRCCWGHGHGGVLLIERWSHYRVV